MQVTDGSATVKTTANAVVLSAETAESGFTSTVLEARTTVAPSGTFYLIKVGGVCGGAARWMQVCWLAQAGLLAVWLRVACGGR